MAGPHMCNLRQASLLTGCCALILTVSVVEDRGPAQMSVGSPPHCYLSVTNPRIPWEKL